MPRFEQLDLLGEGIPPSGISLLDRVAHILDQVPDSRNDDPLMALEYWSRYDGMLDLDAFQNVAHLEQFCEWFRAVATNYESIRRRRQEIQRNRDQGIGHLRPSASVESYRRARDGAGPPRLRR